MAIRPTLNYDIKSVQRFIDDTKEVRSFGNDDKVDFLVFELLLQLGVDFPQFRESIVKLFPQYDANIENPLSLSIPLSLCWAEYDKC